ncbi:chondroitinase family polysaccharide lyase [Flavivirga spongiicola]|uniref:Uncharacterized protein n=1 Tax=Flavivirga spongiicola TaxID=421621 RepID=A0ABU7XYV1_9FLAO|nr:chondroitinase family polysaccharide lyase [Flavivirga sp. MEBiC05379]MDO5980044.1 chondroitinase family polysaccharide lyase [Flavivirga sp. MEBiC05379]
MKKVHYKTIVKKKCFYILLLLCLACNTSRVPHNDKVNDKVDEIEVKYYNWLLGSSSMDYTNKYINQRYKSILKLAKIARRQFAKSLKNTSTLSSRSRIWRNVLFPMTLSYNLEGPKNDPNPDYKSPTLKKDILNIFNQLNKTGWNASTDMGWKDLKHYKTTGVIGLGGTYGNRLGPYGVAVFMLRDVLAEAGILERELSTLDHATEVLGPKFDTPALWEVGGLNSDMVIGLLQSRLCYVLSLPSGPKREKEMDYILKLVNKALTIADGFADFIKSDFTTNHHKNPYVSSYGNEALQGASAMVYALAGTHYSPNKMSIKNISKALLAARIYTNKYDCHRGVSGRAAHFDKALFLTSSFAQMAKIKSPYSDELQGAFLRYWDPSYYKFNELIERSSPAKGYMHTMGALEHMVNQLQAGGQAEPAPNGHWYFNYAGMSVHRKGEWAVIWKGLGKYLWDYEGPVDKHENIYGKYSGAGALTILNGGTPVSEESSGISKKGWDWRRVPGTTALNEPIADVPSKQQRIFSKNVFVGGVNIDESHALSSMQYRDNRNSMEADKSVFYFENYIVGIGSGIRSSGENYDMHTTVFQTAMESESTVTYLNGQTITRVDRTIIKKGEPVSVTDAVGNAFYTPNNGRFSIERKEQTMPDHTGLKEFSKNYISARFLHGKNPSDEKYEYYIEVNGGQEGANNLKKNSTTLFNIHKHDGKAHIVEYTPNKVTGYAMMSANTSTGQLIDKTDVPCMAMVKKLSENKINLTVMNPELGKIEGSFKYRDLSTKETLHAKSTVQPVVLTLVGKWEIVSGKGATVVSSSTEETKIRFECFDGKGLKISLSSML